MHVCLNHLTVYVQRTLSEVSFPRTQKRKTNAKPYAKKTSADIKVVFPSNVTLDAKKKERKKERKCMKPTLFILNGHLVDAERKWVNNNRCEVEMALRRKEKQGISRGLVREGMKQGSDKNEEVGGESTGEQRKLSFEKERQNPNINVQCTSGVKTFSGILPGNEVLDICLETSFIRKKWAYLDDRADMELGLR